MIARKGNNAWKRSGNIYISLKLCMFFNVSRMAHCEGF